MTLITGTCTATFAFEVGQDIRLGECERLLGETERQAVKSRRRLPRYFEYSPPPLRIVDQTPATPLGGCQISRVEVVLYDFGAAAVSYDIPLEGEFESLISLSTALQQSTELPDDARDRLRSLMQRLGSAISRPQLAELLEDYLIFQVQAAGEFRDPRWLVTDARAVTARILRGEMGPLSQQEEEDAVRYQLAFGPRDLTVVDWNAALLHDAEPEDTEMLLEFANVQLLELRHLDRELDRSLDRAYEALARTERGGWRSLRPHGAALRRLGELQVDAAVLFERVSTAVKLVGDRFLGRVYRAAAQRFHFADWDQSISRKLGVMEGIYEKLTDRTTSRRMEVLEWIIILLIAFEVVMGFLRE
jgi:hypothetical protein